MAERGAPLKAQILFSAPKKGYAVGHIFFCSIPNFEEDLWDELPVKQGVDNAL